MNRIRTVIIEDEEIFSSNLVQILKNAEPLIDVVTIMTSIEDSVKWFSNNAADLIFLDIHLADGSCFEIFEHVSISGSIIFITSYDQYAIKAFKLNSIDYLLKPLNVDELKNSINKYKNLSWQSFSKENYAEMIKFLLSGKTEYKKRFAVYAGNKLKSIETNDIAYFYVMERGVFIRSSDGSTYAIEYSLDKLQTILDPEFFFRINRKCIISISSIKHMHLLSKSRIKVEVNPPCECDTSVSLSRIPDFRKWLNT